MKAKSAAKTKKRTGNSKIKKDKTQNSKSTEMERTRSDDERLLLDKVRVAIARELDLSTTLRTIVESVAEVFGYSHVSLYLLEGETLILQHQVGYPQVIYEIPITQGVSGRVARSGQPAFIRDAQDDPAFLNAIDGLTAEICVPIFDEGKVAGTLNIESLQADGLTDSDLKLMIALSESISPAIGRARLYTELRESEERFRLASWATKDALWDWNIQTNQIQWDTGLQKVFHYLPETTYTHIDWRRDHIHPLDREKVDLTLNQALTGNMEFWSKEYRFRRQDGTYANVMDRAYIIRDENGQPYRMIGAMMDITERKQSEEAERDQRTLAEALRDTAEMLSRSLDLRSVFDQILNIVGRVVPHDAATIMLIEDGKLHLGRSKGYKERGYSPEKILNELELEDEGNLKKMYKSRQPEFIPDVSAYPNWKQFPGIDWLRSNVGAPMIIQDNVIGFLLLDSESPGFFTPLHAQRLQAFANQAAIAVQNARLYEAAQAEIRERKQAEDALIQFRNVMDSSNDAIYMIDVETGRYVDFNYSAYELLEYTREELLQKTIMDVAQHIPNIEVWRERVNLVLENDRLLLETMYRRKSGSSFPVEVSAKMLTMENRPILLATVRDVTERKEAQKHINRQLEELTALHRVALAGIQAPSVDELIELVTQIIGDTFFPDHFGFILLDENENVLRPHSSYRGLQAMGRRISFPLTMGIAGKVASSGQPQRIGDIRLEPDYFQATSESVSELCVPIHLGGRVIGVINAESRQLDFFTEADERLLVTIAGQTAIAIDNSTLLKRLQLSNVELEKRVKERTEELNQTNIELRHANRTKDEFLANMSHELRTPLNSILGFSETLLEQRRGPINEKQEQYVSLIHSSGQHLLGLINDILEVSKIEAGKLEMRPDTVFVKEVCESSLNFIKEMAAKKSISVEFKNEAFISTLRADPQRLKQILVNLLSNAVKFTPEKGRVTLEVNVNQEMDQVHFSVNDNGIGIAPENLSKLFIPFSQIDSSLSRQYEGTGLGLALVLKLTELQGGSVEVKSEPGVGSRFTIKLPWSRDQTMKMDVDGVSPTPVEAGKEFASINKEPVKVLLAEDNLSNVLTIQEYLSDRGFDVVVAHNGIEAISLADESSPNIILMDIQMPEMDGLQAIQRLRAKPEFASVPIIALTALAMPGDRERCLEAGANEYLSKPVSLKGLVKKIHDLLA